MSSKKLLIFFLTLSLGLFLNTGNIIYSFDSQNDNSVTKNQFIFKSTLKLGSRGFEVKMLQILLSKIPKIYKNGKISGFFDKKTQSALRKFQKKYHLKVTGTTNIKTRQKLNEILSRLLNPIENQTAQPVDNSTDKALLSPPPETPQSQIPGSTPTQTDSKNPPYFTYSWQANDTITGEIKMPESVPRPVVVWDDKSLNTLTSNSAVRLANLYHIILLDEEEKWDDQRAALLLEMISRLPKSPFETYRQPHQRPWQLILTMTPLTNDLEIRDRKIRIFKDAFTLSNPTLQPADDLSGPRVFYSNRLFTAVLKIFYFNRDFLAEIMRQRFGLALGLGDPADEFQEFSEDELIFVASVLEDLPSGFKNISGLEKLVRRRNGLINPFYPQAAALAWIDKGYIEFMDRAFIPGSYSYIQKLIAHEMTHFLWHKVLASDTRKEFMKLSGWSKTNNVGLISAQLIEAKDHPKSTYVGSAEELWYHESTTNFVSDYAAAHNPDEDFAETMAYYIYQSDKVRNFAPDKYKFIKEVVDGYEYVIFVDKQFTFQVFNLEPDLTFPGKIIGVNIQVAKTENGDNLVTVFLHLSPKYGDGAERAYARIVSPVQTYTDQYFDPDNGNKYLLKAQFVINKYSAKGYWIPEEITVHNKVDNRRYEGQKNFSWLLYIDNPDEDLEPPEADTAQIKYTILPGDKDEEIVRITIPVTDKNIRGLGGHGSLWHYESAQNEGRAVTYDEPTDTIELEFPIRPYRASGIWTFREFLVSDIANNERRYDLKEGEIKIDIQTKNPDYIKPTLDISSIKIEAIPKKPESPDGETDVTIWYKASDDNSGLGLVSYTLLKPNGDTIYDYHYHENFYGPYFKGDPKKLKEYEIQLTLPPGSIPGTWVLREMQLEDLAGNQLKANFVEIGIVKPFKIF